jgi:probable phosphoglycerate mutase
MAERRLVLVRHGATAWTAQHRLLGWTDLPLSADGEAQARALRGRLHGPFDRVYSSDLERARRTAALAWGLARPEPRLREIHFGAWEGADWFALPEDARQALLRFDDFAAPGGESTRDLVRRVLAFVEELPPGCHLLFTHGGVVRALLRACGEDAFPAPCEVREIAL